MAQQLYNWLMQEQTQTAVVHLQAAETAKPVVGVAETQAMDALLPMWKTVTRYHAIVAWPKQGVLLPCCQTLGTS